MFCLLAQPNYYGIFIMPAVAILVPPFMGAIFVCHKKVAAKQNKKLNEADFEVRFNALTVGAAIFLIVLSALMSLVFPITYVCDVPDKPPLSVTIAVSCACGVGSLVCVFFLIAMKRWGIKVSANKIFFTPMFGRTREYLWEEIIRVEQKPMVFGIEGRYLVYAEGKTKAVFGFSPVMKGGKLFAEKLRQYALNSFQ